MLYVYGPNRGPGPEEAAMLDNTTPTVLVSHRLNADRVARHEPASLLSRAIRKARHVESRPANYTTPMLRWAEALILAVWNLEWDEADVLAGESEAAGWLA